MQSVDIDTAREADDCYQLWKLEQEEEEQQEEEGEEEE